MKNRHRLVAAVLAVLVVAAFTVSVGWGAVSIAPSQVAAVFLRKLGIETSITVSPLQESVLWTIRLPRVLMSLVVGAALAVSGVALQSIFRNPLAEPSLLGITSGAVAAAMIAIVAGAANVGPWVPPLAGFLGALIVSLILYSSFRRTPRRDVTAFALTGVVINVFLAAVITMLPAMYRTAGLGETTFWTMGGFGGVMWPSVYVTAPVALLATGWLWGLSSQLNILALGDSDAEYLGVDTHRLRMQAIVLTSLVTGASVAYAGVIAFVGLVVPHALRLVIGPDHRRLLPASALGGALMLCLADILARALISPAELPVGVLTTLAGGPLFFVLLRQARAKGRWV